VDQPLGVGPCRNSLPSCVNCEEQLFDDDYELCDDCQFPTCSKECSQSPHHRRFLCHFLQNCGQKFSGDLSVPLPIHQALLPLRIAVLSLMAKEDKEGGVACFEKSTADGVACFEKSTEDDADLFQLFDNLQEHRSERANHADHWASVEAGLASFLLNELGLAERVKMPEMLRILDIIDTNCIEIRNVGGCAIKAVFPVVSLMSHSCIANARQMIQPHFPYTAECRAKVPIKKGEEITISYVPPYVDTVRRRAALKEGWYFDCDCRRCADPRDVGAMTSALKCKLKGCVSNLLPANPLDSDSPWSCEACHSSVNSRSVQETVRSVQRKVTSLSADDVTGITVAIEDIRSHVHPLHSSLTELRSKVIPIMCKVGGGQSEKVKVISNERYLLKRKLCLENMAVMDIVDPGLSASRGKLLYELQSCLFGHAQNLLLSDDIDAGQFYGVVGQCQRHLAEASRCLVNETEGSNNQKYERLIKRSLSTFAAMLMDEETTAC